MGCVCLWTDYFLLFTKLFFSSLLQQTWFPVFQGHSKVICDCSPSFSSWLHRLGHTAGINPQNAGERDGFTSTQWRSEPASASLRLSSPVCRSAVSTCLGRGCAVSLGPRVETTLSTATADRSVDGRLAKARSKPCSCKASGRQFLLQHTLTDTA